MSIPPSIAEWLTEKIDNHQWIGVKQARTVEHSWRKMTGGRYMIAGLKASVMPSTEFLLTADAPGVSPEYVAAAKNGVLSVLLSQSWSPILGCKISLSSFQVDSEHSCYAAFYGVAEEATRQLLGISGKFPHNIKW